ncbi:MULTISPECIES: RNA methyltransferase [unclassified Coleofasciculus]|uniref:RNA methyltransferase n=1 Tax=unclassified Coleofasciculus TaxID=2692782 RepID=UPI00187FC29A|nr:MULTISPECIES: RNA methyltransferase [unclassified Coleofasciculus]MBE9127241.1 RNA methyltransferase [Coleofasciculus sp. LEGE 07081]MBE9150607.1 RNA methyltransferase [Coleofasciculus sp. LEGE 07092]
MGLTSVRIILVEPAGPLNVGAVARVMKNMGLHQLWLVNPHCNPLDQQARQMAVHGQDILTTAQQVATLPDALVGCQRAIATTARARNLPIELEPPRLALPWLLEPGVNSALIFGPEDRGLSNTELNYAQRFVCIPSSPEYSVLNLAQSVAICCYELYQMASTTPPPQLQFPVSLQDSPVSSAPLDVLEGYYQHLEAVLLKIGYLYPHTAGARMEKFRRLLHRATPTATEVAMLRGILRQTEWALQFLPKPGVGDGSEPKES